ncbi:MAG: VanZ family protein [Anaerolineae bacterium]|nr:VanZ family protein [Anaerolineae bacterium]
MWYITRRWIRHALWAWGPVIGAMLVMFMASAQPKYGPPSNADPLHIYFSGILPVFPGFWEFAIKKSAHVVAFGVLALLILRALVAWMPLVKSWLTLRRASLLAVMLTLAYALLDELHQSFVPGRYGSLRDIGLDLLGAGVFTLVAWRWYAHHPEALSQSRAG